MKFGTVISHVGRGVFIIGQVNLPSQGAPAGTAILGFLPYLCLYPLTVNSQIRCSNTFGGRGDVRGSAMPPSQGAGPAKSECLTHVHYIFGLFVLSNLYK